MICGHCTVVATEMVHNGHFLVHGSCNPRWFIALPRFCIFGNRKISIVRPPSSVGWILPVVTFHGAPGKAAPNALQPVGLFNPRNWTACGKVAVEFASDRCVRMLVWLGALKACCSAASLPLVLQRPGAQRLHPKSLHLGYGRLRV
jgi:hypothetical protein